MPNDDLRFHSLQSNALIPVLAEIALAVAIGRRDHAGVFSPSMFETQAPSLKMFANSHDFHVGIAAGAAVFLKLFPPMLRETSPPSGHNGVLAADPSPSD